MILEMKHIRGRKLILAILLLAALIAGGWYLLATQDDTKQTNLSTSSAAAPTTAASSVDQSCIAPVQSDGAAYELFTADSETYTYTNDDAGISFDYPQQWGPVQVDDNGLPVCVGPLLLGIGTEGEYGQGDGDLIMSRAGFYEQDDKYYSNWFRDADDGPYEIAPTDYDVFKEVSLGSGQTALITASNCTEFCSREATVNLQRGNYEGLGVSTRRLSTEDVASIEAEQTASDSEAKDKDALTSPYEFTDTVAELEQFISRLRTSS